MWKVILPILMMFLFSCKEEEVKKAEIFQIREIGTLSTTEYTLAKIVKLSNPTDEPWYYFGDRKILISCKAKVKAGVNLSKISDEDIKVEGKKIEITLPAPEITSFDMDPKWMKTEMVEVTGFRFQFTQEETTKILQQGERAIRKDMKELNILNDAEKNATVFIKDFYKQLGFEEVIVHGQKEDKRD